MSDCPQVIPTLMTHARKILVCRSELLRYSETFIEDQLRAYRSWQPVLVGFKPVSRGLSLDAMDVRLLDGPAPTLWAKARRRVLADLGMAPPRAVAALQREAAALVHAHFATDAVTFWPIVRRLGLPLIVTLHGYDINVRREEWERRGLLRLAESRYPSRLLRMAADPRIHFVAVSQAIHRRALEFGLPPERISVRPIGIDRSRFVPSDILVSQRERRILYVGRFVEKKGAEFLIRAYARLRSSVPDARLVMIGDGPLAQPLARLAAELSVPVEFLGSCARAEVKRQLDLARVFCLPSVTATDGDAEGLGMVVLEAQACGVPVVTSAGAAIGDGIVPGVTGFSFREKDVEELAIRLTQILLDDALALSMSRAGERHVAERFDLHSCTRSLESLYEDVLRESGRAAA